MAVDLWHEVLHRGTPLLARLYNAGKIKEDRIHANMGAVIRGRKARGKRIKDKAEPLAAANPSGQAARTCPTKGQKEISGPGRPRATAQGCPHKELTPDKSIFMV